MTYELLFWIIFGVDKTKKAFRVGEEVQAMRLLLAEDEKELSDALGTLLKHTNYSVDAVYDGQEALDYLELQEYDGVILDVMMPKLDGISVLKKIREQGNMVPVLILTAKTGVDDRVLGLDSGADDYLGKPFSMKELLSRINALIRRTYGYADISKTVSFGQVMVDIGARTVTKNGKPVNLSLREFDLLAYMCEHPDTALTKDKLLSEVWGTFTEVTPATLTVHMRWLREKLEDAIALFGKIDVLVNNAARGKSGGKILKRNSARCNYKRS